LRGVVSAFGAEADLTYAPGLPPVINHAEPVAPVRAVLGRLGQKLLPDFRPRTASEDFAHFLAHGPGAFLILGAGAPLHSPRFAFNDALIAPAADLWVALAQDHLRDTA
jgi:hippurate hydrolase